MTQLTRRRQIMALLEEQQMDARELSAAVSVREKEIYDHLVHVERTVTAARRRFVKHPSACMDCGFEFKDRKRLTRPGRCPRCRSCRVSLPRFEIK